MLRRVACLTEGDAATHPEALSAAGYRSYAVGKWHLDHAIDPAGPDSPLGRGFERYFGVLRGAAACYGDAGD